MHEFVFILTCLILVGVLSTPADAQVSLTLRAEEELNPIDEKVYGHFLEHIYHSCNGGLWGDLLWDRSFEGGGVPVAWSIEDACLVQEGSAPGVLLTFGSPEWTDYEFSLEARKTGGAEGFLIMLRVIDDKTFYWANLGGWGNVGHALERGTGGPDRWAAVTPRVEGRIEEDHWYQIRMRCEGPRVRVWLDDALVADYTDDGQGPTHGQAGLGTWVTQAQFRNLKVTSLDGSVLFEGLPETPAPVATSAPTWQTYGAGSVVTGREGALNGDRYRNIESPGEESGLVQAPLKVKADEVYRGSLWVRSEAARVTVRLLDGADVLAEQAFDVQATEWQEFPLLLKPTASCQNAALQVGVVGTAAIDQVSLMPDTWRAAGGFRLDLLDAIRGLRPPVIRWPGGCFASPYRWKDGIGPQHERKPHPILMWEDKEVNSFGTDEYVAMCRAVGAEPLIVVNIGTETWNPKARDNDFLQEVLDWIEYCNGPADSPWGKVRARNGHPEPYGVKYWEIDNETWHMGAEAYAAAVKRFAPAMRQADPSIKLAACGSGGHGDEGYGLAWNRVVIDECADLVDYLSIHHYAAPDTFATDPLAYEAFFRKTGDLIAQSRNPGLKIYVSEWNAQSTDWRTGLYAGGLLNAFERCGDILEMGGPALFLRHVYASDWDNAFVNFDHTGWFPAPNYVVMKLWRDHYAPRRVGLDGESGPLNVVASRLADGSGCYVKLVNPSSEAVAVSIAVPGAEGSPELMLVAPGNLQARNTLASPHAVKAVAAPVNRAGDQLQFEMPPLSAGVLTVQR